IVIGGDGALAPGARRGGGIQLRQQRIRQAVVLDCPCCQELVNVVLDARGGHDDRECHGRRASPAYVVTRGYREGVVAEAQFRQQIDGLFAVKAVAVGQRRCAVHHCCQTAHAATRVRSAVIQLDRVRVHVLCCRGLRNRDVWWKLLL